nr:phosphodiester glycosidase family protein [Hoyosella altamirensis]
MPDEARTGRSAIGYSPKYDRLFLIQAGSNMDPESGLTQAELGDLLRGLGAAMGVQLDSGGSSALLVHRHSGVFWAGQGVYDGAAPAGACPELEDAVCSPGISPDGESRRVPAWLGIGSPAFPGEPAPEYYGVYEVVEVPEEEVGPEIEHGLDDPDHTILNGDTFEDDQ